MTSSMTSMASITSTGRASWNELNPRPSPVGSLESSLYRAANSYNFDSIEYGKGFRNQVYRVISLPCFELLVVFVIVANFGVTVYETDAKSVCLLESTGCGEVLQYYLMVNVAFNALYALELAMRVYVHRKQFFADPWSVSDFLLIIISAIGDLAGASSAGSLSLFRNCRVVRLIRAARLAQVFHELYLIAHGLISALKALFWAAIMLLGLLAMWGVLLVDIINPLHQQSLQSGVYGIACERCPRAFSTVSQSVLTLFQTVIAGEGWESYYTPIIEAHPWTSIIFFSATLSIVMGLMNLITAVVVDCAADAREADIQKTLEKKAQGFTRDKESLIRLCNQMDTDQSGSLSLAELLAAFTLCPKFGAIMRDLDVEEGDVSCLFQIMDEDRSGDVSVMEFVEQLYKMKSSQPKTLLTFIKHDLRSLIHDVEEQMDILKNHVSKELASINEGVKRLIPASVPPAGNCNIYEQGASRSCGIEVAKSLRSERLSDCNSELPMSTQGPPFCSVWSIVPANERIFEQPPPSSVGMGPLSWSAPVAFDGNVALAQGPLPLGIPSSFSAEEAPVPVLCPSHSKATAKNGVGKDVDKRLERSVDVRFSLQDVITRLHADHLVLLNTLTMQYAELLAFTGERTGRNMSAEDVSRLSV